MKSMQHELKEHEESLTTRKQNPNYEYYQTLLQGTDEKYQEITYWKYGKFETVHSLAFTPIDLQKALHEAQKLLPEHNENIGFSNGHNKDAIDFTRVGGDDWRVQVPIFTREKWDGYYWRATSDTKCTLDIIRLFFDELEWFGMLDFKMDKNAG